MGNVRQGKGGQTMEWLKRIILWLKRTIKRDKVVAAPIKKRTIKRDKVAAAPVQDPIEAPVPASPLTITSNAKYYIFYGLDLAPGAARKLTFEEASEKVPGLRMADHGDRLYARIGEDYSVMLFFKKTGGVEQVAINAETASGFLGVGTSQYEQVWSQLGYRLQEHSGQEKTWSNGDAIILARHRYDGSLVEAYYAPALSRI
jgi:hypothetical protein